jgi:uncharacterized protein YbbC (DUF1343 family)
MVKTGLERLFESQKKILAGKRIAIAANPSAIRSDFQFIVDLFLAEKSWTVVSLFGPEHGIRGEMQAQELCSTFHDPRTGLPVHSLYGQHLKPGPEMLQGIDAIVFDIQDVGSRYYTFIYTLSYIMEACAELGILVVVLDRPNPINGVDTEGPILEAGFESFVGRYPIPIRHGMTVGEIAVLFNQEFHLNCPLEVVPMENWKRTDFYEDTGLPWVLPSPNMPNVDTAMVYPGMCLFEGTNISEGRGTTRPFEIFGAPWIDPDIFCRAMESFELQGVRFRPLYFRPTFDKFKLELCGGAQMHLTDRRQFRPVRTALCILWVLRKQYATQFQWKEPPYEFVHDQLPIDILFGNSWIRENLEKGISPFEIEKKWSAPLDSFNKNRLGYLLYK